MEIDSIYQFVKNKLLTHGVDKTKVGQLTLNDKSLFILFVDLERSSRQSNFESVQCAAEKIEKYLISIGKRHLMAFVYLYLKHNRFTPKIIERDETLNDGKIKKSYIFLTDVSNEERLIGLWARVKYDQVGETMLRTVYAEDKNSLC
jgi:hypothetical protein